MVLKFGKKEYKLRFGYRAVSQTGILEEVQKTTKLFSDKEEGANLRSIGIILDSLAKFILVGLQREEEFACDFENEAEVKRKKNEVCDFLDDYFEQEDSLSPMDLFYGVVETLTDSGFFAKMGMNLKADAEIQDATKIPQDHKKR